MEVFCESERTYLRKVRLGDAARITAWKNDPLIREMSVGFDADITVENQEWDIRRSIESSREQYWIITIKEIDKPIGYIRINWIEANERYAWLRFGLGEERGKGYAGEALGVFVRKLFSGGTHRIDAEVYDFNKRSLKLLEAIGFKKEGVRRAAYYDGKEYSDIIAMGLLKEDLK